MNEEFASMEDVYREREREKQEVSKGKGNTQLKDSSHSALDVPGPR